MFKTFVRTDYLISQNCHF